MILAAGRGERMRPLTDTLCKPLVPVRGAPLIEHHIKKLVAIGVRRIVINVSYLAEQLMRTLGSGTRFGCELIYGRRPGDRSREFSRCERHPGQRRHLQRVRLFTPSFPRRGY
jgi:NDP-sugar pyrophosphorylase family protein